MSARPWFLASVLVYAVVLGWAWTTLPEGPVPLHFGADGTPDRFGSRDEALVSFAALGLGTAALMGGLGRLLSSERISFRHLNLPHKDHWARAEQQPVARRMIGEDLAVFGTLTMALLSAVVVATVRAARSGAGLGGWLWLALGGYLVLMLGWSVHMHTARYRPPEEA